MEKHVNWSLNLTRNGPHQEINEVEPVNRIDWFVHGYLMNWFNPASAAKKKTHLAQPITLNIHSKSAWARFYVLPQSRNEWLVTNGDRQQHHLCSACSCLIKVSFPWFVTPLHMLRQSVRTHYSQLHLLNLPQHHITFWLSFPQFETRRALNQACWWDPSTLLTLAYTSVLSQGNLSLSCETTW